MLAEKPIDMGWADLPWDDMLLQKPSSEVCHHSTIQAHGIGVVPAPAQIASKGFVSYVKLAPDLRFTVAAAPACLLVHSESSKTQRFSRPRHTSSYHTGVPEKAKTLRK